MIVLMDLIINLCSSSSQCQLHPRVLLPAAVSYRCDVARTLPLHALTSATSLSNFHQFAKVCWPLFTQANREQHFNPTFHLQIEERKRKWKCTVAAAVGFFAALPSANYFRQQSEQTVRQCQEWHSTTSRVTVRDTLRWDACHCVATAKTK